MAILLIAIGGYFINGFGGYSIIGFGGYSINGYLWLLY
jgi:hypothetical protein